MANKQEILEAGSDRTAARAREDYVKAILQLGDGAPVRAADVARYLGVSRVSVSKAKAHLEAQDLIEPSSHPRAGLRLTRNGRELAVKMVRRHRLLETFLHVSLGVPLERVHSEAERIEHVISDDLASRLAELLGRPALDPHGHRIPYGDDEATSDRLPSLAAVAAGTRVRIVSLDDHDDGIVRSLALAGVLPGLSAAVKARDTQGVRLRWGRREAVLPLAHAAAVRVQTHGDR